AGQQRTVYEELQTFSDVLTYARLNHVDSVRIGGFVRAAIDGALRSLDPHSYFLSREDWEQFAAWQEGRWVTTGVFLEYENGANDRLGDGVRAAPRLQARRRTRVSRDVGQARQGRRAPTPGRSPRQPWRSDGRGRRGCGRGASQGHTRLRDTRSQGRHQSRLP